MLSPKSIILKMFLAICALLLLIYFFSGLLIKPSVVQRVLRERGYEKVQIMDKSWFMVEYRDCNRGASAKFRVKATDPKKNNTEFNACVSWPKNEVVVW